MGRDPRVHHGDGCGLRVGDAPDAGPDGIVDGRYRLGRALGMGMTGRVFEALDVHLDRTVALKILRASTGLPADFEREARAVARIRHHNVPVVTRSGCMVRCRFAEMVEGKSLAASSTSTFSHGAFVPIYRRSRSSMIALALSAAHACGTCTGTSPQNVIIEICTAARRSRTSGWRSPASDVPSAARRRTWPPRSAKGALSAASDQRARVHLRFWSADSRSKTSAEDLVTRTEPLAARASVERAEIAPYDEVLLRPWPGTPPTLPDVHRAAAAERIEPDAEPVDREVSQLMPIRRGSIRSANDDDPGSPASRSAARGRVRRRFVRGTRQDASPCATTTGLASTSLAGLHLPGMNGVEVLAIRALPGGETVSVVVIAGVGAAERWRFVAGRARLHQQARGVRPACRHHPAQGTSAADLAERRAS